mgnify:CR=1 FL=1
MKRILLIGAAMLFGVMPAFAQEAETVSMPAAQEQPVLSLANARDQEHCITVMAGFPDTGHQARYQFFKLAEMLGEDAPTEFRFAVAKYGQGKVDSSTPVADVIEGIVNPVLRQAAPEMAIAQMGHLIDFAHRCEAFIDGQTQSLEAFDASLSSTGYYTPIAQDALFLKQVLSDLLFRVKANQDPQFGPAVKAYAAALVSARDRIEYRQFEDDIGDLEALYMNDLDGRLARSNDMINSEINTEITSSSIQMAEDMNQSAREQRKQEALRTLFYILNGY